LNETVELERFNSFHPGGSSSIKGVRGMGARRIFSRGWQITGSWDESLLVGAMDGAPVGLLGRNPQKPTHK